MGIAYQIRNQEGAYFLTFQVVGWVDIFSRKIFRDIIIESLEFCRKERDLELFAYVIMTNHVHVIMRSKIGKLSETVRDFKRFTSRKILFELRKNPQESRKDWLQIIFKYHARFNKRVNDIQFWTHENHAVELSSNEMIDSRFDYIHNNPVEAGWVSRPEDYLYSSARNYSDLENMMEIDRI